tara:strand:+ start:233 stop:406 length:174 start_codon:yes stop_codon:yes gene_type:complete
MMVDNIDKKVEAITNEELMTEEGGTNEIKIQATINDTGSGGLQGSDRWGLLQLHCRH